MRRPLTAEEIKPCEIARARICTECGAVTGTLTCPWCDAETTVPHPEATRAQQRYCITCADPFTNDQLRVITAGYDPYRQDEGLLVCICMMCLEEEKEEFED